MKSEAKFLGRVAFWVSEILVITGAFSIFICSLTEVSVDISFTEILLLQGSIFTVVWGAKAHKNYVNTRGKNGNDVNNNIYPSSSNNFSSNSTNTRTP